MHNRFCISQRAQCTGAYSVRAYSLRTHTLAQPILNLATYSLHWDMQSGGTQYRSLHTRATDFAFRNVLIALEPTAWGPTIYGARKTPYAHCTMIRCLLGMVAAAARSFWWNPPRTKIRQKSMPQIPCHYNFCVAFGCHVV